MVAVEFLLRHERHRGVVVGEVVGHLHDGALDGCLVGAVLGHHEAFARVLLARHQLGVLARAHGLERRGHRNRVLARVRHAVDAADGVAVALGDAAPPERVVVPLGQDAGCIQAGEREHAGVPPRRDEGHGAALLRRRVHAREVVGDVRMGVERVHHVAQRGAGRRLLGKVARAAAAQDQHVDVADVRREVFHRKRPARPRWRAARFAGSRRVNSAASSMSAFCRHASSTPLPKLPYPTMPMRVRVMSCSLLPVGVRFLAFGFHDGQKGAPRPARNEKSTNRASPAKAARRRRRPTGRRRRRRPEAGRLRPFMRRAAVPHPQPAASYSQRELLGLVAGRPAVALHVDGVLV